MLFNRLARYCQRNSRRLRVAVRGAHLCGLSLLLGCLLVGGCERVQRLVLPPHCVPIGYRFYKGWLFLAPEGHPSGLYLFYNITRRALLIDHPVFQPNASAGWSSELHPEHWSAFWVTGPDFPLECRMLKPYDIAKPQFCQHVIQVCRLEPIEITQPQFVTGEYWVAEDLPYPLMMERVHQRGFVSPVVPVGNRFGVPMRRPS